MFLYRSTWAVNGFLLQSAHFLSVFPDRYFWFPLILMSYFYLFLCLYILNAEIDASLRCSWSWAVAAACLLAVRCSRPVWTETITGRDRRSVLAVAGVSVHTAVWRSCMILHTNNSLFYFFVNICWIKWTKLCRLFFVFFLASVSPDRFLLLLPGRWTGWTSCVSERPLSLLPTTADLGRWAKLLCEEEKLPDIESERWQTSGEMRDDERWMIETKSIF